jgi:predicted AAA+ superfamily ATPase
LHDWLAAYVATYLERDVRQVLNIQDLTAFQRYLRLCAGRTGQLLNLSALAGEAGISHGTARAWLSFLEASYLVHLLPPYHRNFGKRLVKTPKLYFIDTGLAAWLLGIREPAQLALHPLRGALFESLIVGEFLKGPRQTRISGATTMGWRQT